MFVVNEVYIFVNFFCGLVVDEDIIKLMNYWCNVYIFWIKSMYKWNNINGFFWMFIG